MANILGHYMNGNVSVMLMSDGTKYRYTHGDAKPEFPESIDLKICNKCDMGCPMCHENSTPDGECADIMSLKFIDTLNPYTEVAIGGGNPLEHPQLVQFLHKLQSKHVIANMTVNQKHFISDFNFIYDLCDRELIRGLGVSLTVPDQELIYLLKKIPHSVVHVIAGYTNPNYIRALYDQHLKLLVLGYKQFRRGESYATYHTYDIAEKLKATEMMYDSMIKHFDVVSFDNLAVNQLGLKNKMSPEEFMEFYMGDDGSYTMYIDAVNGEFAKSSVSRKRGIIRDNIGDMFSIVRAEYEDN